MAVPSWPSEPEAVVDAAELRRIFNKQRYYERALAGSDVSTVLRADCHPARTLPGHPTCTRSQFVYYIIGETLVAAAHQYLLPDGSLGGSGRPDPKIVLAPDGRVLRLSPSGGVA